MAIKGNVKPLVMLLSVAMTVFTLLGALVGLLFGNVLFGALTGALLLPVTSVGAFCMVTLLEIMFHGQWG